MVIFQLRLSVGSRLATRLVLPNQLSVGSMVVFISLFIIAKKEQDMVKFQLRFS